MSLDAAHRFYADSKANAPLAAKVAALRTSSPDGGDSALSALVALAKSEGYEVTADDMLKALEGAGPGNRELSDQELQAVAGGSVGFCGCQWPFKSSQLWITQK
jgi:predicted ribosomally synthesized peptide with nif11-like leader